MSGRINVDKKLVLNILSRGLGYPLENIPSLGEAIRLSSKEAFVYAVLTSFGYLDCNEPDNLYRLTRSSFRVFNQANQFELQEGIFSLSDMRFASTINTEVSRKPYIKNGPKFILPVEFTSYTSLQEKLQEIIKKIKSKGLAVNDFIITPIKKTASGVSCFESFFEFVVSIYFSRHNFITDTQIPFFYGIGTPDIAAYKMPDLLNHLTSNQFLSNGGNPIELMAASVWGFEKTTSFSYEKEESIVFEVKTNQKRAEQIKKYTDTKIFNKAYEVIPYNKLPEKYAGLITTNKIGQLLIFESPQPIPFSSKNQKDYFEWIEIYLKSYLLANLKTDEFEYLLAQEKMSLDQDNLIQYLKFIKFNDLVKNVKKILIERGVF